MNRRDLEKYLRKARLRPVEPAAPPVGTFRHFIVIPVMDELEELPRTLEVLRDALPADDPPGVLLVVNHGVNAAPERKAHNLELLRRLRSGEFPGVLWIDAASPGRELADGVGEARRIGLDTALSLIMPESPENALLVSLDADSHVAPDYWPGVTGFFAAHPACGALSIGVRHRPGKTPEEERAIRRYEKFMDDYVAGLRSAGSPYAFYTIGSAIAVRASSYIACGGMRVRSGGEDFYFLQALAKVTQVGATAKPLVFPASRPSDRVPFGTGPAVRSLLDGGSLEHYPPETFAALKELMDAVADGNLRDPARWRGRLAPAVARFLDDRGFFRIWPNVLANTPDTPGALAAAFHQWFDGLKTLQFLRAIRDSAKNLPE